MTLSDVRPPSSFLFQSTRTTVPRVPTLQPPIDDVTFTVKRSVVFGRFGASVGVRLSMLQSVTRDAKVDELRFPRTTARKSPVLRRVPEPFDIDAGPAAAENE